MKQRGLGNRLNHCVRTPLAGLFLLAAMLPVPAQAFTVNLVDGAGNPISGFRWLVEVDNTDQPTLPGNGVAPAIGGPSVSIHKSHAPVVTHGDTASSSATVDVPADQRYFLSVLPHSGYSNGGAPVAVGQEAVTVTLNQLPLPTAQISIWAFVDHAPINNLKDEHDPGFGGCTIAVSDFAGPISQDIFGNPLGTRYQFVDANGNGFHDQGEEVVLDPDGNPIPLLPLGNGTITTLTQADFAAASGRPDDPATPLVDETIPPDPSRNPFNLKVGEALVKYIAPGKYGMVITPPQVDSQGNAIDWRLTSTIEGTKTVDAWVKANEPKLFVEGFGTGFNHAFYAFVNPDGSATSETGGYPNFHNPNGATAGLGYQVDAAGDPRLDINDFPFPLVPPLNWVADPPAAPENGTITGTLRLNHFSRPPNLQGFFAGEPVPEGWIGLNDPAIRPGVTLEAGLQLIPSGLYATAADPDTGAFTISNVPPGTYQLVNWDLPLDYLFGVRTVTVGPGETVNLGNVLVFRWFGTFQGSVFLDDGGGNPALAGNGFRDPGEIGIAEQNVNIRFRDGTIYQFQPTDINGEYEFGEVFPFFKWLVPEVDFARFKATGVTNVVDYGGDPVGITLGDRTLGVGKLAPQPQAEINPNTGDNLSRTETGEVLTQAMHLFLGQTNNVDWGKAEYGPAENGGISGIVYYAVTRAENDPRLAVGEEWEPGIPRVVVNLYRDMDANGIIDDLNGDGLETPADVDNYPFGWQDGGPMGPQDIDHDGDGQWNPGDALNITTSDSWDDNPPSGCIQNLPVIRGETLPECSDSFGTWNQIRPGVFDGGYAFNSYFPGGMASGNAEVEGGLPTGTYIVEAVTPPGYELLKEENKNVDFGDTFTPSPQVIPALCVGEPHTVPQFLTFNSDGTNPLPGVDPAELIPNFFAGQTRPLCNRKQVIAAEARNAAVDFFYLTQVPKAARAVGFANNDLGAEFNMASPNFGEKLAPSWIPVSFHDWTGREITRVYTDEFGGYNALLPSTYTVNVPSPSGVSPNMLTLILNNPILPDGTRDPHYDPTYSVTPWTFDYWPGKTSYLDTPLVPVTAFAANDILLDTNLPDGTPVIGSVAGNEPEGGALICSNRANGRTLTLRSAGTVQLRNPAFDAGNIDSPLFIQRDFGFGPVVGQVTVTVNGAPEPLDLISWTPEQIVVTVPDTLADGITPFPEGTFQLTVTRGDNGRSAQVGETFSIVACGAGTVHMVSEDLTPGASPIQDAIDVAVDGDLILVGPGTYNENVIMYKPVRLQGAGSGKTFINGNPTPLERLDAWHRRIEAPVTDVVDTVNGVDVFGLGGAEFSAFLLKFPFSESEAPGIVVIGEIDYPGGNLQVPDPTVTRTFSPGHSFPTTPPADPPRIDGFTISGSKAGGGIFAVTAARYLVISNNEITNNQGNYAGGIAIGTQDSGFDAQNTNIVIRDNHIHANGGVQGPGGVVLNEYANDYLVEDNLIIGNFSRFHGGGIQHRGLVPGDNVIRNNRILFNENFFNAILARAGDGGGIHIGGDVVGGTGAGNVTIEGNLIQGNMTGSGSGGGIRAFAINAGDIAQNPGNVPQGEPPNDDAIPDPQWYELKILNNIIVNNVAGLDGGGISLQDVVLPTILNNTIANNDSTATGILAFAQGASNSVPQPAGIATTVHSPELQALLANAVPPAPVTEPTFSDPVLVNNIIFNNRSFFNDASLNAGQGGLAPNPAGQFWDLGVLGTPGALSPANCLLTSLTGPDGAVYDPSNLAAPAQPVVRRAYFNSLETATILDEGGNNINVRFTPTNELAGDYHLRFGSAAIDAGQAVDTVTFPSLSSDVDGQGRPNGGGVDIGADEFYPVSPTQIGVWRQGFWYLDQNGNGAWDALSDIQSERLSLQSSVPVAGDWDGDGRTEFGFYSQGAWYLDKNGDGVWSGPGIDMIIANFGSPSDLPAAADIDGDATAEVGVFRPATGQWFFDLDNDGWTQCQADGGSDFCIDQFGSPTDLPVAADVDNDGSAEVGVYRPSTGQWFFDLDNDGWTQCQADGGTDLCIDQFGSPADLPVVGDVDNDGFAELGIYRQASGQWFFDLDNDGWTQCEVDGGTDLCAGPFGSAIDLPVIGDWNGNGIVTIGTYRPNLGIWYLDNGDGKWDVVNGIDVVLDTFGAPADIPVTGDWDGDGISTIGTYRQGQWFLGTADGFMRGTVAWNGTLIDIADASFGAPTDLPVAGDWNGDGKDQLGVYRQGQWFLDYNGNRQWDPDLDKAYANFGAPTDLPVAGDVDGDGISEIGVWRPATGQWFFDLDKSGSWSGCGADLCLTQFGAPTDIPVTGDWDGDGVAEVGTYRQGTWFLDDGDGLWDAALDTAYINFGAPTDIPVTGVWNTLD